MSCDIEAIIDQRPISATIEQNPFDVTVDGAIVQMNGLVDGDYGDIAVSNNGATMTIENMGENATVTTGTYASKVNQDLLIKVRKASAGTITKGQVVYIVGSTGNHLTVELARANAEATSAYTIGIAATTITGSNDGFVIQNGRLTGLSTLPTASFSDGNALYLSETTAGDYRVGIPEAPNHGVFLGFVIRANNGSAGELDVRIDNYQELEELSDVYINNETVNDFLVRKATRWENTTPANVKTILAINNVNNTSDLNKPISTATQIALDGKVDKVTGKGLSTEDYTTAEKNKLAGIEAGAQVNTVTSVAGKTGAVSLVKADVGLSNVDNTSDLNKPISTATQTALNAKENTIATGTVSQYYRGDKTFQTLDKTAVGLGNVSNTDTTTTANITDSSNKRFITDAQQTVLGNTSGTNTGDQNIFSTIAVASQSNVVADSTSDTLTLIAGSNITLTTNATNDSITIASTGGGSAAETFETVSKNLKAYPAAFNYTTGTLTSIVYTLPVGTITKTLNYTSGTLTSIVLSGDTPAGIDLTKTLGYTGDTLTSITYS